MERFTVLNRVTRMTIKLVAGTTRALPTGSADEMLTEYGHTPSPGPIPQKSRKSWEECTHDNCHCRLGWRGLPSSVYSVGPVGIEGTGQEAGKPASKGCHQPETSGNWRGSGNKRKNWRRWRNKKRKIRKGQIENSQ